MARSRRFRDKIQALEDERAELVRKAAGLAQTQQRLVLQNAVLSAWCETLSLLQVQWGGSRVGAETAASQEKEDDEGVQERFEELLNNELRLLNELTVRGSASSCSGCGATAVLPDPGPEAISPGDPMHYLMAVSAPVMSFASALCSPTQCRFAVQPRQQHGDKHAPQATAPPPSIPCDARLVTSAAELYMLCQPAWCCC
jgi:hypothetical protein